MNYYEIAEIVLGSIELFLTIVGLILIVFGWIIPYKQKVKIEENRQISELNMQKTKWEKELVDKQISQFYGPISAIFEELDIIFKRVIYAFGRKCIFDSEHDTLEKFSEYEKKIWIHFVETYNLPFHQKVVKIIRENKHLIYDSDIPKSFSRYMDYALGWELLDNQKRNNVPNFYEYRYLINYPVEFVEYINKTLGILLRRQSELTGQLGSK